MIGTTVYLAGGEVERLAEDLLRNGVKNILLSYFYILRMKKERYFEILFKQYPEVNWFLDSGAFTYYARAESNRGALPPIHQYVRRYFNYIDQYGHNFCRVTEPDMDVAGFDEEQVEAWLVEMLERWPHLNVTPTWHFSRGLQAWETYLQEPRIKTLAIGSGDLTTNIGMIRRMVMQAAEAGKPVHGFGCTRVNTILKQVPFDSVDSSSWLLGQKIGATFVFRNNRFQRFDDKKHRRKFRSYFKHIGCDPNLVIGNDLYEVRKANIIAWRNLSARLEYQKFAGRQARGVNHAVATVNNYQDPFPGASEEPMPQPKPRPSDRPVRMPKERG